MLQTDVMQWFLKTGIMIKELLQKIKFVLECKNESQAERIIEQFIFHQEELTIEFADWLNNGRYSQYGNVWINPKIPKNKQGGWQFYTSKELLEIFKKERSKTITMDYCRQVARNTNP